MAAAATLSRRSRSLNLTPTLSPINILEVLQISDEDRRERLIYILQLLCDDRLLHEPESLFVDYIARQLADKSIERFRLETIFSDSQLAAVWRDVRSSPAKTFITDQASFVKLDVMKALEGYFHAHYSRGGSITNIDIHGLTPREPTADSIIESFQAVTQQLRGREASPNRLEQPFERIWIAISTMLCTGFTPYPDAIDRFWKHLNISPASARVEYAVKHFPFLATEGPFVGIGVWLSWCATLAHNRGNLFDALHLGYLPYIDRFLTLDSNIIEFAKDRPRSAVMQKVEDAAEYVDCLVGSA